MGWYEIVGTVKKRNEPIVSDLFHTLGANGVLLEETSEDMVLVKGYFETYLEIMKRLKNEYDELFESLESSVVDPAWKEEWKEGFKHLVIKDKFSIQPLWDDNKYDYPINILLEPGMSFGTGGHETTRMAIRFIDKYLQKDAKIVDIGCGSGILSIISAKLGATDIVAIDIDEEAIRSSQKNFKLNKVENVHLIHGNLVDQFKDTGDLVIVNMIPKLLLMLADDILDVMKEGALLIVSGIFFEKKERVFEKYKACGLEIIEEDRQGEWISFVARRSKDA